MLLMILTRCFKWFLVLLALLSPQWALMSLVQILPLIQNAGSATTGNSAVAIDEGTQDTTSSLPIRIIDVVRDTVITETSTGAQTFPEFIVKINIGTHQYTNSTGV
jgi:hypothetical protein